MFRCNIAITVTERSERKQPNHWRDIPMCTQEHLDELRKAANEGRYSDIPNPLTAPEAAAIARRSRVTIARACQSGQLKASNTGTRWNVNRDSLLAYAGLI